MGQLMDLSLNEVEATAKKAARGAGYPWGLAEEAGRAARWLCSQGLDGCRALAILLELFDGNDLADWTPQTVAGGWPHKDWTARRSLLCPLATGAAISDHAHELNAGSFQLNAVAAPLLLLPFAALAAQQLETAVSVSVEDCLLCTDGNHLLFNRLPDTLTISATISLGGTVDNPSRHCTRAQPKPGTWASLLAFAHRTYAPASDESRLKGAGAGLSDND